VEESRHGFINNVGGTLLALVADDKHDTGKGGEPTEY
jgi:hypothetical protein